MPDGTTDNINQKGIDYYNKLIDALLAEGRHMPHFNIAYSFQIAVRLLQCICLIISKNSHR